jgi:hypothetical protein
MLRARGETAKTTEWGKQRRRKIKKKKAINWLTCVHVTNTSPHVVKSHYLFERLLQTLRCLFFLDFFFSLYFIFSRQLLDSSSLSLFALPLMVKVSETC